MKRALTICVLLFLAMCAKREETAAPATSSQPAAAAAAKTPDVHSFSRPDEVKVEHLSLDLDADFAKKQLVGKATLKIKNLTGADRLVLDSRDLAISKVTLVPSGKVVEPKLTASQPIFGSALEIPIEKDTSAVTIEYATSPNAAALQWLGQEQTAGKKHPFLFSQSQSILARTWAPIQDTPSVRFTYDATIRAPKELLVVMSASNPQARTADGAYRFDMPQPIPSYLLAIAIGDIAFRQLGPNSGVYAEPATLAAAAKELEDTPKMIEAAEKLFGPYRWGRYDMLILPPAFPFGGMENPRLTFLTPTFIAGDKSLVSLVSHELAHSWSGNLVTNSNWNDFWLNEGFTSYAEHRIIEALYGREYEEMLASLSLASLQSELPELKERDEWLAADYTGRDPDDATNAISYDKGHMFVRLIEQTVGREKFDPFLRDYFERFAFKPMDTNTFLAHLRSTLLKDQPELEKKLNIDAWVYGPGIPANVPTPKSDAFAKVEAQAKQFAGGAPASSLDTAKWSTHEWIHFVQQLPTTLGPERMADLDGTFKMGKKNNEILEEWLSKAVENGYKDANADIERFLTVQGRRKYLKPIYTKLAATEEGKKFAREIYAKARPTYHAVSQQTIDEILK